LSGDAGVRDIQVPIQCSFGMCPNVPELRWAKPHPDVNGQVHVIWRFQWNRRSEQLWRLPGENDPLPGNFDLPDVSMPDRPVG
jgi:hypothetical protein